MQNYVRYLKIYVFLWIEISLKQTFKGHLLYFSWNLHQSFDQISLSCTNMKQKLSKFQIWTWILEYFGIFAIMGFKLVTKWKPISNFWPLIHIFNIFLDEICWKQIFIRYLQYFSWNVLNKIDQFSLFCTEMRQKLLG